MRNKEELIALTVETLKEINFAPQTEEEEVLQNVKTIITTTKYSVPMDRDFGLSATMVDSPSPKAAVLLRNEIIDAIRKYEPRAHVHSVTFEQSSADVADGILRPVVVISLRPDLFVRWNA